MNRFEEGLPHHFVVFSQTPKAQEHSRRLYLLFCAILATPLIGILAFQTTIMSIFFGGFFPLPFQGPKIILSDLLSLSI